MLGIYRAGSSLGEVELELTILIISQSPLRFNPESLSKL